MNAENVFSAEDAPAPDAAAKDRRTLHTEAEVEAARRRGIPACAPAR